MNRNDYMTVSGADYIRAMYANTKADSSLTFEENGVEPVTRHMDWTEEKAERIAAEYEKLLTALNALSKDFDRWVQSTEGMPANLLEIWNTYILPYPDHGLDDEKLFDISMKWEMGEPLTEEEQTLWNRCVTWMEDNALNRLPKDRCNPAFLILRVRRYTRLTALHAPKIIVDIEAHYLAEELALYRGLQKVC